MEEQTAVRKEREAKDDGRYIIYYTFEDEEAPRERDADEEK